MENYELMLTEQAEENIEDTLDTLITAAQEIASASEKDFEKIKAKKWYKLLWELVTFDNDNQKIRARGVGNLAKLNEITLKAIVLVSKQNKDTAEKVQESLKQLEQIEDDVSELYEQQTKIITVIQKIKRGFETEERFDELSENQRNIIFAILHKYAQDHSSNEDAGKLLATMRKNAHDTLTEVNYSIIETELTSKSSQKILFSLIHVYSLLLTGSFANEDHEIFQYISLSENEKNKIRNRIQSDIKIYGKDEYIKFFDAPTEEYETWVNSDNVEWECIEDENEETVALTELEVLNITTMVHISNGETKIYSYKEIHLGSLIHNCGTLVLDNCTVFYNENDFSDEISCDSNAEIYATNCTFVCGGIDKTPLITVSDHCNVSFDKCAFIDCSHFILTSKEKSTLVISNCEMLNCYEFAEWGYSAESFELTNTSIRFNGDYFQPEASYHSSLFNVDTKGASINNILVTSDGVAAPMLFNISYGTVINSTFYDIKGEILRAQGIENCLFENCNGNPFSMIDTCYYNGTPYVKSCVFDNCSTIIFADKTTNIEHCKFVDCQEDLIHSGALGGVAISYCEFINYKNGAIDQRQGKENSDPTAGIKIQAGKGCKSSTISKCIFDGIDINEGFLISSFIVEKVSKKPIRVIECDFRNCVTKRESGKIIKQYSFYYNLFSTLKNDLAITIENCRGLEKVKKEGVAVCQDENILANAKSAKAKSGAKDLLLPVSVAIAKGPVVGILAAGVNLAIKKKKEKEKELSDHAKSE